MRIRSTTSFAIATFFLAFSSGCSESTTEPGDGPGSASFTISGALDAQQSGSADFNGLDLGALHRWEIYIHDAGPTTFELTLSLQGQEPIERPGTGTYVIDFDATDPTIFVGSYADIAGSENYQTIHGGSGILTITDSNADAVSGTFQFTAASADGGGVTLTNGEFTANARSTGG